MAEKYYAVARGKRPGIYTSWGECESQVKGFSGAVYKSFKSAGEAEAYMEAFSEGKKEPAAEEGIRLVEPYAFVDGSFNAATGVYGCGGFLVEQGRRHEIQASADDPEAAKSRNVAGEVLGATEAIRLASRLGLRELTIYYDYNGIEMWATGAWKRNIALTQEYNKCAESCGLVLHFVHVKGHSGIPGNEEADRLAKEAVGIGE